MEFRSVLTPDNDITASSQFGVNGNVTINQLNVNPNSGLVELPTTLTDSSQKIVAGCAAVKNTNFIITGHSGLPSNPNDLFNGEQALVELSEPILGDENINTTQVSNNKYTHNSNHQALVEAQGWIVDGDGRVHLVAKVQNATNHKSGISQANCQTATF